MSWVIIIIIISSSSSSSSSSTSSSSSSSSSSNSVLIANGTRQAKNSRFSFRTSIFRRNQGIYCLKKMGFYLKFVVGTFSRKPLKAPHVSKNEVKAF